MMIGAYKSTIETGFRIPGKTADMPEYLAIAKVYNSQHIQVCSTNPKRLWDVSRAVLDEFEGRMELSYYLDYGDTIDNPHAIRWDRFFRTANEFHTKFLVVSLSTVRNLALNNTSSLDTIETLVREAEDHHMFLCLEATPDALETGPNRPVSLVSLKEMHPSHFLMFTINIDDLRKVPMLAAYTKLLRTSIATVHLQTSSGFSGDIGLSTEFAKLVSHLFWLPFMQQPLIFTNPIRDLPEVYNQFVAVTESCSYYYL